MRSRSSEHGNAMLVAIISVLVMSVAAVGVVRYASREVAGATAARKQAAIAACAEAARGMLMSQWKLLGARGVPDQLDVTIDNTTPTKLLSGHYGEDAGTGVQLLKLSPLTVGAAAQSNDLTNRIGNMIQNYRVVVHCKQGTAPNARELELEFAVNYGI